VSNEYAKRQEKSSILASLCTSLIVISFVIGLLLAFLVHPAGMILIVLGGLIGGIGLAFTIGEEKKNSQAFKEEFLIPRMQMYFSEFEYKNDMGLQRSTISDLGLFYTGDSIYTNDLIQGKYRGCSFRMGNVKCTETYTQMDGDRRTRVVFQGRVIIVGLSVLDSGQVTIKPKSFYVPTLLKKGQILEYDHPICDNFEIRSYQPVELPRYFLDYVNNMAQMFNKYKFYYKIVHDRIYIAIDNISPLYKIYNYKKTTPTDLDDIIRKDSMFFTNLISLIVDASKMEK
jgi:hypothetical protein